MGSLSRNGFSSSNSFSEGISVIGGAVSSGCDGMVSAGTWRVSQAGASS